VLGFEFEQWDSPFSGHVIMILPAANSLAFKSITAAFDPAATQ
jgi:hypothetical protein